MAFIRVQNIRRNDLGVPNGGTAAITVSTYVRGEKYHSKQIVRERLGKVIWLSSDNKTGIFQSPTRGLIGYDSTKDEFFDVSAKDERITGVVSQSKPARHVVFGDSYVLLEFMKSRGLLNLLRNISENNAFYERLIGHICHGILKDRARISRDDFLEKSFLQHLFQESSGISFGSDTPFFTQISDDRVKVSFFQSLVKLMKTQYPEFGNCCYVDSTPLPNDIGNNPFNALCRHGTNSCGDQTRLVLVLDERTGIPVWFSVIPGNILDLSTSSNVREEVYKLLSVSISSLVLDAGYASKENPEAFADAEKFGHLLLRMPAKNGYPFKSLYHRVKDKINRGKYAFVRHGHTYFGKKEEVEVFGNHYYAFVYVDQENALAGFRQRLDNHAEEYETLLNRDKDFYRFKSGYFILLSNSDNTPEGTLDEYFGRTDIESFFKTSKEHLGMLPLRKWSETTIKGKLLFDIISTVIYIKIRKEMNDSKMSVSSMIGKTQSLMCLCDVAGNVTVETPTKGARSVMELLGISKSFNQPIPWFQNRYLLIRRITKPSKYSITHICPNNFVNAVI
jgi:hypothetical protein